MPNKQTFQLSNLYLTDEGGKSSDLRAQLNCSVQHASRSVSTISTWWCIGPNPARSLSLSLSLSHLSAFARCQGAQDLEPLLVSICTPDLKCGFAVTRLLSEASGDREWRESTVPGKTRLLRQPRSYTDVQLCCFSFLLLSGGIEHTHEEALIPQTGGCS